jgi:hypothetical protein
VVRVSVIISRVSNISSYYGLTSLPHNVTLLSRQPSGAIECSNILGYLRQHIKHVYVEEIGVRKL